MKKEIDKHYKRSNHARENLLLLSLEELKSMKRSCRTRINSFTLSEKEKMAQTQEIYLSDSYTSHDTPVTIKAPVQRHITDSPIKLNFLHSQRVDPSLVGKQPMPLSEKKLVSHAKNKRFQLQLKMMNIVDEETVQETKPVAKKKGSGNEIYRWHDKLRIYYYWDRVDKIINFLNKEKCFFDNPFAHERSEKSFYYLHTLCGLLKIRKKHKDDFHEIEEMMMFKEHLDESQIKPHRNLTPKQQTPKEKFGFQHKMSEQISLKKSSKFEKSVVNPLIVSKKLETKEKNHKIFQCSLKDNKVVIIENLNDTVEKSSNKNSKEGLIKLVECKKEVQPHITLAEYVPEDTLSDASSLSSLNSSLDSVDRSALGDSVRFNRENTKHYSQKEGFRQVLKEDLPPRSNSFKINLINC